MVATVQAPTHTASWEEFGTTVVLRLLDASALEQAESVVRAELEAIDRACSRFRADSELSALNASAGRRTEIGALLQEALELSLGAAALTDGALDPTVGLDLQRAGYDRDWSLMSAERVGGAWQRQEADGPSIRARRVMRWERVDLDRAHGAVRIPVATSLDLGATAKAWAADRAAQAASRATGSGALLSIGGDIACAGDTPPQGWLVRVTDDHRGPLHAPGQTIRLPSGGLATSSTTTRRWQNEGRQMHHIIDPLTGEPARSPWRTVSVAAENCAQANIASTATLAKAGAGAEWLRESGLPARLVDHAGKVLLLGEWPRPDGEQR